MSKTPPKDDWQTPPYILDRVLELYDGTYFDPCPANPVFDGLSIDWEPKAYINPPFSKYKQWARYGLTQPLEQVWICHHDHSTERFQLLMPGAILCLLFDRVRFIDPATGRPGGNPERFQTLIYRGDQGDKFAKAFGDIGAIYTPSPPYGVKPMNPYKTEVDAVLDVVQAWDALIDEAKREINNANKE